MALVSTEGASAGRPEEASFSDYQLHVVQGVLLALLAKERCRGSQLRAQLRLALGPLAQAINPGHLYVGLSRLEKAGLVRLAREAGSSEHKLYELTASGRERMTEWLADTAWPRLAPAEFHLKLVVAASAGLADPIALVDAQRHALLAELAAVQRVILAEREHSVSGLLLEGVALRLRADLDWLEACANYWISTRGQHEPG
jgi:DNA-binding PadR family transcriptional regulator